MINLRIKRRKSTPVKDLRIKGENLVSTEFD